MEKVNGTTKAKAPQRFTPLVCAQIVPEDVGSGDLSDFGDSEISNLRVYNSG
jgi:hypothetical protein